MSGTAYIPIIGQVQIASVPDRNEPDQGETDVAKVLGTIRDLGYEGWFGAEYRPRTGWVFDGIAWLADFRRMLGPKHMGSCIFTGSLAGVLHARDSGSGREIR